MEMGTFAGDAFASVRGMPHCADDLAFLYGLVNDETTGHFTEVRVQRADRHIVPVVAEHDIPSIIRETGLCIDKRDLAVGHGVNGICRFPAPVALEALDVDSLVEAVTFAADATEHAGLSRAFDGGLEIVRVTAGP